MPLAFFIFFCQSANENTFTKCSNKLWRSLQCVCVLWPSSTRNEKTRHLHDPAIDATRYGQSKRCDDCMEHNTQVGTNRINSICADYGNYPAFVLCSSDVKRFLF